MSTLQIVVFNVGAGQSILLYPNDQKDHAQLIDCGGNDEFSPVDYLVNNNLLPDNRLGGLILTNYDHDHFSWLPDLWKKITIWTSTFPKNISSQELINHKDEVTDALNHVCHIKNTYTVPVPTFNPVYEVHTYHLNQGDLDGDINTNHLSQIVFVTYKGSKICVAGDLEAPAWEKMLLNQEVKNHLASTHVLIAPHHGRENGYHESIFSHCNPEIIILSDKPLVHETQEGMVSKYSNHVVNGISFAGSNRKVLTTRNDGHILINFNVDGSRIYEKLAI